jgi:MoaA/NifB/PqqE/SkfB family radical SAM enzyme
MTFRLFTNGSLVTDDVARRLAELRPVAVELSLHGARAETHDRTTATPGSFDALWRGVAALKRHAVPTILKTPLTRINEHELDEMVALTEREGIPYNLDAMLTHRDDGDPGPLQFSMTREGFARYYALLARRKQIRRRTGHPAGSTAARADDARGGPRGKRVPLPQWRKASLGNVRETRLLQLWKSSTVRWRPPRSHGSERRAPRRGGSDGELPVLPGRRAGANGRPRSRGRAPSRRRRGGGAGALQATTGT